MGLEKIQINTTCTKQTDTRTMGSQRNVSFENEYRRYLNVFLDLVHYAHTVFCNCVNECVFFLKNCQLFTTSKSKDRLKILMFRPESAARFMQRELRVVLHHHRPVPGV